MRRGLEHLLYLDTHVRIPTALDRPFLTVLHQRGDLDNLVIGKDPIEHDQI